MNEEEFLEVLYESIKESYPESKNVVKKQFELIKAGETPYNIIGLLIEEDTLKFLALQKKALKK